MAQGKREDARAIEAAQRRVDALRHRQRGLSYRSIAAQLSISEGQARQDVKRALGDLAKEQRLETMSLRQLELSRLDDLYLGLAPNITLKFDKEGKLIEPLNLDAVDRALKIIEQRAKLLGLYAPTKIDMGIELVIVQQAVDALKKAGLDPAEVFQNLIRQAALNGTTGSTAVRTGDGGGEIETES